MKTIPLTNSTEVVLVDDEDYPLLSRFATQEEAARAYDQAAIARWGEFARTNFREGAYAQKQSA